MERVTFIKVLFIYYYCFWCVLYYYCCFCCHCFFSFFWLVLIAATLMLLLLQKPLVREHFGAGVSICPKWASKEHDRSLLLMTTDFQLIVTASMLKNWLVQPHFSTSLPLSLSLRSRVLVSWFTPPIRCWNPQWTGGRILFAKKALFLKDKLCIQSCWVFTV